MKSLIIKLTENILKKVEKKVLKENRTISEQILEYVKDAILSEENPDLSLFFIKQTLKAKAEIEAGICQKYKFGLIQ